MRYLYKILTSKDDSCKNVIVRHHNGDIWTNLKKWVKITDNGIDIPKEWVYKNEEKE